MSKASAGIAGVIVVFLLVAGGAYVVSTRDGANSVEQQAPSSTSASVSEVQTGVRDDDMYAGVLLAGSAAPLLDFTKADYEEAKQSDKLVMLYFYATWCPICKKETADALYPAFNELTDERVIGFRVNYNDGDTDESEKALARELGVAYQHTKVFLKNGERILKSPEGWDKARYLAEIVRAIR